MASGKRASMREGPLAQLFRKTEEDARPEGKAREEGGERRTEEPRAGRPLPERRPAEPRAQGRRPIESRGDEERERREEPRPEPPHGFERRATEAARRAEEREEHRREREQRWGHSGVPTPEERLRSVFSADIPENILDREPAAAPPGPPEPQSAPARAPVAGTVTEPTLRVVGVGGAGVNAVDRMIEAGVEGVEFIAVNTDLQSLEHSLAETKVHIGSEATRGRGSGSDPELGRVSAVEEYDRLKALLKGADMVFITAGAGGGTGTGAAPVVARIS